MIPVILRLIWCLSVGVKGDRSILYGIQILKISESNPPLRLQLQLRAIQWQEVIFPEKNNFKKRINLLMGIAKWTFAEEK